MARQELEFPVHNICSMVLLKKTLTIPFLQSQKRLVAQQCHFQRRIQSAADHLRLNFLHKHHLLTVFAKSSIFDVQLGSEYTSDITAIFVAKISGTIQL